MPKALVIGGTGQIGLAVAERLAGDGWDVALCSRRPPPTPGPWQHIAADRRDRAAVDAALSEGADLVLDCIAFDVPDADQLLDHQDRIGRIAVVSSASVYADADGLTLDEAGAGGFPNFPVPITEEQPTVAPGPDTYSTRKVALERSLLVRAKVPVTILRPCAIHGPYSRHAREWWFLKRLLDGRKQIPLAFGGRSQFQTTSTRAIADAMAFSLGSSETQVLNVADADAPTVAEIGRAIMDASGISAELVAMPDAPYPPALGGTPWSVERPMICASSVPNTVTYAEAVPRAIEWLIGATRGKDWREVLPQLAAYPKDHFDYDVDDRALVADGAEPIRD